jgi:hypothetical protein
MADQHVRTADAFPGILLRRRVVVFALLVPLSILSAGATSGDRNAVRVKRIATPTYVSLVIENVRAYTAE